ncbi:hypothetical protein EVG20_g2650 [Dentipellis fragilis]|uniref:Uncharacterized protein n=1 Tax=Dentipellis fragilis TaxID=205917 RepID=A0A4Y9ZAB3_9AGAM|nr:hypothetical protein EVG20_g2650 [Dentipellis fragilis]
MYASSVSAKDYWLSLAQPRFPPVDASTFHDADKVTDAQQTLDNELHALHWLICAIRTHRNSFSITSRLPSEILARVFAFVAINEPPSSRTVLPSPSGPPTVARDLGWIRVTHVSHHWREVAMQDAGLWGNELVFTLGHRWFSEMLDRAKAAPLTFTRDKSETKAINHYGHLIASHLTHTRHLWLSAPPTDLLCLGNLLTDHAPMLETLEIVNTDPNSCVRLPPGFLSGNAPKLRRMTLRGCYLLGTSPIMNRFTSYAMRCPLFPSPRPSQPPLLLDQTSVTRLDELITSFGSMPHLETIIIERPILPRPAHVNFVTRKDEIVRMPRLSLLNVTGTVFECTNILERLTLPPATSLGAACVAFDAEENFEPLLSLLSGFSKAFRGHDPFLTVCISPLANGFALKAQSYVSNGNEHTVRAACLRLCFLWRRNWAALPGEGPEAARPPFDKSTYNSMLRRVFQALGSSHIQTLSIDDSPNCDRRFWSAQEWLDVFALCSDVKHIRVGETVDAKSLFEALTMSVSADPGKPSPLGDPELDVVPSGGSGELLFPKLSTLWMSRANMSGGEDGASDAGKGGPEYFVDRLTARQQSSTPLSTLYFNRCTVPKLCMAELRRLAKTRYNEDGPLFLSADLPDLCSSSSSS